MYKSFCLPIHSARDTEIVLPFGHWEQCCNEHRGTNTCVCVCFHLLCVYLEVDLLDHIAALCLSFLRNCSKYFHSGCHIFTFPPTKYKGSNLSLALSILVIFCLFKSSYSNGHEVVFLICISLVICDAEHLSKCLLVICNICLGEMSVQDLCSIF